MADQQSSQAALTNVVGTWYSKKILESFEPKTVWFTNAPIKEPIPMAMGKTVNFDRYKKIDALFSDDTDEFTAQQMYFICCTIKSTTACCKNCVTR